MKCHLNDVSLKWLFAGGPMMAQHWILACFFRGSGPVLLKSHTFLWFFRGKGAQWLSGRVLGSRPKGCGFEPPRRRHCGVVLDNEQAHIYPSLVLVQPRKSRPCLTERLLMGRKESKQTNKTKIFRGGGPDPCPPLLGPPMLNTYCLYSCLHQSLCQYSYM